jgi:autotransporter-associated beta strand protein/T5SS/PEP-CTERM-associated repeat protein
LRRVALLSFTRIAALSLLAIALIAPAARAQFDGTIPGSGGGGGSGGTVPGGGSGGGGGGGTIPGDGGSGPIPVGPTNPFPNTIGYNDNGSSFEILTVTGGSWSTDSAVFIGYNGKGSVVLSGGDVTTKGGLFLGVNTGGFGSAEVSSGTWIDAMALVVGLSGSASLRIDGGHLYTTSDAPVLLGYDAESEGIVTVDSGGWQADNSMTIGVSGTGALNINSGGSVVATDIILASGDGSHGTLNLNAGGFLQTSSLRSGSGVASVNFSGGLLRTSASLSSSQDITLSGTSIIDTDINNPTFSGVFSGSGGFAKVGSGTMLLTGRNIYTGQTLVSAGTLLVNGSIAGDAIVNNGAVLSGSGTIGGSVYVTPGGTLAPGDGPGLLTIKGDLVLQAGATLVMEFAGLTAGLYDQLDIEGTFIAGDTLNLVFIDGFTPVYGASFTIFTGVDPGFDAGSFIILSNLGGGLTWDISQLGSTGVITVVPEPATGALIVLGLGMAAIFYRRRLAN